MDKHTNNSKMLAEEDIGKLLMKFSIPAIIGMMVNALYNIVDRIFIGQGVGNLAIGGIFVGYPISLILMAFSMLIGIGGNTVVSIRLGEKKKDEAEKILGNSFILLVGISVIISILGLLLLEPLLRAFGASETILPYAVDYMKIILIGAPLQAIGFGMNNFIRGEGSPKIAMITMLIGAILNTILDPIFIFIFDMGIKGAALATIISQGVSAIWVMKYFIGNTSILRIRKQNLKLRTDIVKNIVTIGFAPFSMQLAASMVTVLLNNNLKNYGGDVATSSMGVIQSISMMVLMPIFGINQGSQPIIGFNYGAKNYDRVKKTLKLAIMGATVISLVGFILTQAFPKQIIKIFISDEQELAEILNVAVKGLRIYLAMLPIIGFQIVSSNYFQATGKPKHAMLLSLSRQVLILIPALLIFPKLFELTGVWMAAPVSDLIASIITGTLLAKSLKNLNTETKLNNLNNIIEER
ncbi:MATE family efflux transporter [Tissierella sp. MSJ-40]|uniref:Multidrug export protein MepA n=1 Tax=Tissierella simiarum TaxID=2841534 RepID=A0ABS6E8L6_9FIRM|nr:MATE family efflux transporter [Tissierella simiarum]MBU5439260.1 MATE family efflux transporter [Tissierella simiarum]